MSGGFSLLAGLTLSFATLSCAFAGAGSGGGGAAAVCRDAHGQVVSAQFYDLFATENDSFRPRKILRSTEPAAKQIDELLDRYAKSFGDHPAQADLLRRSLGLVQRDWSPLKSGIKLTLVPDFDPIIIPSGPNCEVETMGSYDDELGVLRVDAEIYDHLSETDRAAFRVHEAVYKIMRVFLGEKDSLDTRDFVSRFFSQDPTDTIGLKLPTLQRLLGSLDYCEGFNGIDPEDLDFLLGGKSIECVDEKKPSDRYGFSTQHSDDDIGEITLMADDGSSWEAHTQLQKKGEKTGNQLILDDGNSTAGVSFLFDVLAKPETYTQGTEFEGGFAYQAEQTNDHYETTLRCHLK